MEEIKVTLDPKLIELFNEADYNKFVSKLKAYNQPNKETAEEFWEEYDREVRRVNRWKSQEKQD